MTEFAFTVEWTVWIPIVISSLSLLLAVRSARNKATRDHMNIVEKKIDRAHQALKDCEENLKETKDELKASNRQKDELRREKYALLEQVARLSRTNGKPPQNGGAK